MALPEYQFFEEILKRESGIVLTPDRSYLLESRLLPVAYKHGLDGLPGMAVRLKAAEDPELLRDVVEALAAGETNFFRDFPVFEKIRNDILPQLFMARAAAKSLRIWSAGCASGQEPYSIAMMIKDSGLILDDWSIEIVATDLSQDALSYARAGSYSQLEVQRGLPVRCLVGHFTQEDGRWKIRREIQDMVHFEQGNLMTKAEAGAFDIIFCRHVLQNFDTATQMKVLQALRAHLRRDGTLVLGRQEPALNVFKPAAEGLGIYSPADIA